MSRVISELKEDYMDTLSADAEDANVLLNDFAWGKFSEFTKLFQLFHKKTDRVFRAGKPTLAKVFLTMNGLQNHLKQNLDISYIEVGIAAKAMLSKMDAYHDKVVPDEVLAVMVLDFRVKKTMLANLVQRWPVEKYLDGLLKPYLGKFAA